ncbi:hypothetical protein BH10PSE16_BH10PSE16_01010 [soil metagenome]
MRRAFDVCSAQQGHQVANMLYKRHVKPDTQAGGRGRLIWEPIDTTYRHQLRKLFHGPVLTDFSEQVRLPDPQTGLLVRYTPPVWKQHLTDVFCPARFEDGKELAKSTEALNDDEFADFLLACQAYGTTDCGVVFTEQDRGVA